MYNIKTGIFVYHILNLITYVIDNQKKEFQSLIVFNAGTWNTVKLEWDILYRITMQSRSSTQISEISELVLLEKYGKVYIHN